MTQDMEREHKKHRVTPFRGLTNRLPYVAASLRAVYTQRGGLSIYVVKVQAGGGYTTRRIRSRQRRCSALVVRM